MKVTLSPKQERTVTITMTEGEAMDIVDRYAADYDTITALTSPFPGERAFSRLVTTLRTALEADACAK